MTSALVVGATAAIVIGHWGALTAPYAGPWSDMIVRPVASVIRIGIVAGANLGIGFVLATLLVGKLPKRLGRTEWEFDSGPDDGALVARDLDARLQELENAQKALMDAFDDHQATHSAS